MEKPKLSTKITIIPERNGRVILYNNSTQKTCSIGPKEYKVLLLCDGVRSLTNICSECTVFPDSLVVRLIKKFEELGLLEDNLLKRHNKIWNLKIGIIHPNNIALSKNKVMNFLYKIIIYVSIPIFILGLIIFLYHDHNFNQLKNVKMEWFVVTIILSLLLHEFSHMVVAICNGAYVSEMGFMLKICIPCLYTSVIGTSKINNKMKRIEVYAAGILMNLFLIGIGFLGMYINNEEMSIVFMYLAIINILLVLINLIIFIPLDGYYIFQEIINEQSLFQKAISYNLFQVNKLLHRISQGNYYIGKKRFSKVNDSVAIEMKHIWEGIPRSKKIIYPIFICFPIIVVVANFIFFLNRIL